MAQVLGDVSTSDGIGSARPDIGVQPPDPTRVPGRPDDKPSGSGRVRVDSSDPTELKHENDQLIKKKLTKISKKCLELLYSVKICNFGRLSEKFHCGKSVFGEKLFFPSVFGGLSGRFVGCRRVVGFGSKFFVGFGSEKPTRSHH
jgi:hypothetical protein